MKLEIRKATVKDLERIDEIYVDGSLDEGKLQFPGVALREMEKDLVGCRRERVRGFRKEMASSKHYWVVAVVDGNIIGFGQAWLKSKEIGMVEKVYVDKAFRKEGVGVALVRALLPWLRKKKVKHIEASLYWKNVPSRKLCEKLGFAPISIKMRLGR